MKLLGHRSAADDVARLDDPYLQTRFREIEGADEAVVAGTDDEGVIGFGHETSFASGDSTCRRPKPRPGPRPGIRRSKGMRASRRTGGGARADSPARLGSRTRRWGKERG